ncbi:MAG: 23S rRNA (adenine(2030)-N(6))-methyltransferase RlmJ [Rhizobiaceae bacterium]|nr:23S rRNA (adenine(2030)-N(6))-methyltransferase RlmJ [Rhizobiaceae bacterium]MCV0406476.1 23S rRNA (adenine(2030)-N(6))-methyltransferase RlmJ [Rhizobiaceae bacterium]
MNYRHAYHAGNFADVVKHVVLARIVEYLKRKDKPFRVIDTHAGKGFYDLTSDEAQRTGEWRDGVGRVLKAPLAPEVAALVAPWLDAVRSINSESGLLAYPGSPVLVRHLLRPIDRLTAIELHPADATALKARFAGDRQARIIELDGWLALGAHLPPKEKRGLVLVDPPFEEPGDFGRLTKGLTKAHRRWPGGIYALWYPVKHRQDVARFRRVLGEAGIPDMIDISLTIRAPSPEPRLDGCGMVVVNPPFTLESELRVILPPLSEILRQGDGGGWSVERLAPQRL